MPDESPGHSQFTSPELWEKLKHLAREHRHTPTEAENYLWQRIRNRQLDGVKFRRQHAIGPFIVDFYAAEHYLIVEIDGAIHRGTVPEDRVRQAYLETLGFRVLRFSNDDVLHRIDGVLDAIAETVRGEGTSPLPPP